MIKIGLNNYIFRY